ncbi:Aromatic prenyltransferase, DMATS type, partial [Metarhizium majus ARSEF 297]
MANYYFYYGQIGGGRHVLVGNDGSTLGMIMQQAGYNIHRQFHYLLFYYHHIVPLLGKKPTRDGWPNGWESFMTDDHTPIELSWSWSKDGSAPTVRFLVEPIAPNAGSCENPLNQNTMTMAIRNMASLFSSADLDLGWYEILSQTLTVQRNSLPQCLEHSKEHHWQTFVAFDLNKNGVLLKAYFLPGIKAEVGTSRWFLVKQALGKIASSPQMDMAISRLAKLTELRPEDRRLEVEIIGIDCIKPEKSTLKIYLRSRLTTFDDVQRILTLGETLKDDDTMKAIQEVQTVWSILFGVDAKDAPFVPLAHVSSRTSGILYYFELNQTSDIPYPKVQCYLPVRHYGQNDLQISEKLESFLAKRHRHFIQDSYANALRQNLYAVL